MKVVMNFKDNIAVSKTCSQVCVSNNLRRIIKGDCLSILKMQIASGSVDLVYTEPPTKVEKGKHKNVRKSSTGSVPKISGVGFSDIFDDYLWFLKPRLEEIYRVLSSHGSLLFHSTWDHVHYCKILLDTIFGRECFKNQLIWAYDHGVRSKYSWSKKHDVILWYAKNSNCYTFNSFAIIKVPYSDRNDYGKNTCKEKPISDVFYGPRLPGTKESIGYISQRPSWLLEMLLGVHSDPGDLVLDPFSGSGATGIAAAKLHRNFILIENSRAAYELSNTAFMERSQK